MKTIREEISRDVGTGVMDSGALPLLDDFECRVWRKWDRLKSGGVLRVLAGLIEAKVIRPILGDRPAGCTG